VDSFDFVEGRWLLAAGASVYTVCSSSSAIFVLAAATSLSISSAVFVEADLLMIQIEMKAMISGEED